MSTTADRARWAAAALALALALTGCSGPSAVPDDGAPSRTPVQEIPLPAGVTYRETVRKLDGKQPSHVRILTIHPDAQVRVAGAHGSSLARAETVRAMAGTAGALAAVNASYFDISGGKNYGGYDGDPLGLYAEGGRVLSEATNGRPALLLGYVGDRLDARIQEVATRGEVLAQDGAREEVDGINRVPGRILGCGGVGGDRVDVTEVPMEEPYGGLCTDSGELVAFTGDWGERTPPGPPGSMEALLDADGRVMSVRKPAGGAVPQNGSTLYAIGTSTAWLRSHVEPGSDVVLSTVLNDTAGTPVFGAVDTAIGGRYRLLRAGAPALGDAASSTKKAPRTAAGVTADGTLLVVTVDGRAPGVDAGATLSQTAKLLASLGARDAIGLDGGGSTTMVVRGELRNSPREVEGEKVTERPVANVLALFDR
ncbi:phosphodiester glycosidase family protein [Streptomyces sp. ISL-94]|uniref:phosphodiester glycosidase family protein n=1 Tax=Streptomyces sp. ISL-94 TaxID=2819190 RepID=UPI001BECE1CC|nr:phosphodiester glycosidase family protein [Streptomyces sp. ISL-94]MBT2477215.1 phosphodiester glycosidase family protein [Streptomyces sp. ISL-94]